MQHHNVMYLQHCDKVTALLFINGEFCGLKQKSLKLVNPRKYIIASIHCWLKSKVGGENVDCDFPSSYKRYTWTF